MSIHLNPADTVFHDGERQMHAKLGVSDRLHELGRRMIRNYMPDQHREFFAMLRMVHLGAVDAEGHPWAITRTGPSGFMRSPDDKTLVISAKPTPGEPENLALRVGGKMSVLGLEMETRRRNRMNATITGASDNALTLSVDQSYGNCPKYIQTRTVVDEPDATKPHHTQAHKLDSRTRDIIENADILMLATRAPDLTDDPRAGVDINHRGGMPGFVKVIDDSTVEFPDYRGNNFYNSFGNILLDNRVGLQFFEFETGATLNVKGTAELIEYDHAELPFMGRSVRVRMTAAHLTEDVLPLRYELAEYSPNNPEFTS